MVIMTNMIMIHGMVASLAKVGGAYGKELFSQKEKVKCTVMSVFHFTMKLTQSFIML